MCFSFQLNNGIASNWTIELLQIESLFVTYMLEQIPYLKQIFVQSLFQHAQLGNFPLYANSHTALQIASIDGEFVCLLSLCKTGLRHVDNLG